MDINVNSAIIVTDSDLIKYFTGFEADDAFLIIYNNENHLFVDNRYYYATRITSAGIASIFNRKRMH